MQGGPRIRHLDDVPFEEMLRFRFRDGRTASVWEKWIELSPRYVAFYNRWDPGAMTPSHGHHGDHVNLILQGEIRCGDIVCGVGSHITLEYGDIFGPWVAGPEGCTLYGFTGGEASAFQGDTELWQRTLAEQGAEMVPVPMPKRMPPWWKDRLRKSGVTAWAEEDATAPDAPVAEAVQPPRREG